MLNTTGKSSKIVVKDVYYDPSLQYNLVSVTEISRTGYVTTFSTDSNQVTGLAGAFELIKTCGMYALPVWMGWVWTLLGIRGFFWGCVDPFGCVWTLWVVRGGPFWVGVDPFGDAWTLLGVCGPFWERVDPFRKVWTLQEVCGPFWERVDQSGWAWTLLEWYGPL